MSTGLCLHVPSLFLFCGGEELIRAPKEVYNNEPGSGGCDSIGTLLWLL